MAEKEHFYKSVLPPYYGTTYRGAGHQSPYSPKTSRTACRIFPTSRLGVLCQTVKGIERYQEEVRDHWLDEEDLKILWDVLEGYPNHLTACIFKLLILTGARKGELIGASWDQFDLDRGVWTKPSHLTKQKKTEHLPLSPQALEILNEMKSQATSPFVFPGKVDDKPVQEIKKAWETIRKKSGFSDLRIHDLRHTHAAHLATNGLTLNIVGKLLGHTQVSTTQKYAHLADRSTRQAATFFGDNLDRIIGKEKQAV